MDRVDELENQIKVLRRQLERVAIALDETRRRVGLSHLFVDDQVAMINAKGLDRGRAS